MMRLPLLPRCYGFRPGVAKACDCNVLVWQAIEAMGIRLEVGRREDPTMKDAKRETSMISRERCMPAVEHAGLVPALHDAENEGWPQPGRAVAAKSTFFGKIASFFRDEYASATSSSDITLEQLYRELMSAAARDRLARNKFQKMMFVIASDIRDAKAFPLAGLPVDVARPMSAWRERYNGLDHYLGR